MKRLREWREKRSFSVRELAKLTGISAATVTLLETSERHARPKTARDLAKALGVEPEELY